MIQIYGRFDGYWSHAQVSRGIAAGLHTNGLRDIQICNVSHEGGYEGLSEPIECGGYNVSLPSGMSSAPIGFFVGGYPPQMASWLDGHRVKVALFITESAVIPKLWAQIANQCHIVVVPSEWVGNAYQRAGVDRERLLVIPHGIHPLYQYAEAQLPADPPRFLHVCGSASFPQRKGTPQLIEAFCRVFPTPDDGSLVIRLMPGGHEVELAAKGRQNVHLDVSEAALRPDQMVSYQCGGGFCTVIQPSRGEAFGIVPVEARAVGLPMVMTHCTGHLEHASAADIVVEHGLDRFLQTNGIPNGAAPSVSADAIEEALRAWKKSPPPIRAANRQYARNWSWPEVTRKLALRLKTLLSEFEGPRSLDVL